MKLAAGREKAIEIGETIGVAVTHAFDAIERDAAHGGEAGDGGCFHIDEAGVVVGGGEALFFGEVGNHGAGEKPELACARIAVEALAGANVNDAGDVVGRAWRDFLAESSGPADGKDKIDGTAVLDGGEGAGGGVLSTGSGTGGDPFFFPFFFFAALAQK